MEDEPATVPVPSDSHPAIAAFGDGDVAAAVVSMSSRHPDGLDADYLRWHMLDHLPEQYRLVGLRWGQRWISTPACRAARSASEAPFDEVDHVVQYLFAEPVDDVLAQFFPLGNALGGIGRMQMRLPRVQVGGWNLVDRVAADRVLVGACVVPWRPASGIYLLVERAAGAGAPAPAAPDALTSVPGVTGAWTYVGGEPRHVRLESTAGLVMTVCYLDRPPVDVAADLAPVLVDRWADGSWVPQLAAPLELVVAGQWDRHLP